VFAASRESEGCYEVRFLNMTLKISKPTWNVKDPYMMVIGILEDYLKTNARYVYANTSERYILSVAANE